MQKITPHLWFDDQAEEAANYYTSIFKDGKIHSIARYPKEAEEVSGKKAGSVMTIAFEIAGQNFVALNGGPIFKFNESISFMVDCGSQEEIDYFWEKLSADPKAEQCGWCKDKFGVSWQIVPKALGEMLNNGTKEQIARVTEAFLKMKKFDIKKLNKAFNS